MLAHRTPRPTWPAQSQDSAQSQDTLDPIQVTALHMLDTVVLTAQTLAPWWISTATQGPRGFPILNCIAALNCQEVFFSPLGSLGAAGRAISLADYVAAGLLKPGGKLAQVLGNIESGFASGGQPTTVFEESAIVSEAATAAGLDTGYVISVGSDGSIVRTASHIPERCVVYP